MDQRDIGRAINQNDTDKRLEQLREVRHFNSFPQNSFYILIIIGRQRGADSSGTK